MMLQKDTLKGGMHVIFVVFTTDFSESIFFSYKNYAKSTPEEWESQGLVYGWKAWLCIWHKDLGNSKI